MLREAFTRPLHLPVSTTRTMPPGGTYGGQGKAAGSSDLPAALLSALAAKSSNKWSK